VSEQLYNLEQLESIGDAEFVKRMITIFVKEASGATEKLLQAYKTDDFATIKYVAHRIRPSLNNLGIPKMKEVTIEMEDIASQNTKNARLEELINNFNDVVTRVVADLKAKYSME